MRSRSTNRVYATLQNQRRSNRFAVAVIIFLFVTFRLLAFALTSTDEVTVDDLLGRTVIRSFSLSPDGSRVAFLTTNALPRADAYRVRLYVQETRRTSARLVVAKYVLPPDEAFDSQGGFRANTVCQYVWSSDSRHLLYTVHRGRRMELRLAVLPRGISTRLIGGHQHVEIGTILASGNDVEVKTFDISSIPPLTETPRDLALLMKDSYRFDLPLRYPRREPPITIESWKYQWNTGRLVRVARSLRVEAWPHPDEYVWNGHSIDVHDFGVLPDEDLGANKSDPTKEAQESGLQLETVYDPTQTVIHIRQGGSVREILRDNSLLIAHYAEQTDRTRNTGLSASADLAVLVRSINLVPDELVLLDLQSGKMSSLFAPNEAFRQKTQGITVRVMPIPVAEGKLSGRLFLPAGYSAAKRYPLVFTTYLSTPGFNLGSGEVPILSLVTHDVAVFALDARDANEVSHNGDFDMELRRLQTPRMGMEWLIKKLSEEGIIDPERVGVSGLSYGAEISMYVYWRSRMFRAVSAATASWHPALYSLSGVGWEGFLKDRGFVDPTRGLEKWRDLTAGLNGKATLPPLLWQAPESERLWCAGSWFDLRRAGAQVEWLEYPDEGHVKRSPADQWWVQQRNLDWFRFWLKDEEDPEPDKSTQYTRWRKMRQNWESAKKENRAQ